MEMLSQTVNSPIVRIPGRAFPGVVIQGDSLRILYDLAEEILEYLKKGELPELEGATTELKELLTGYLLNYEAVLKQHKLALPYTRSIGNSA